MFIYKIDKHGFLQKCKVWLMIYENQQASKNLFIRITILASMTFHVLMTIIVKFDLETVQLDNINTFVNCKLDEMIYMKQLSGFKIGWNIILQLQKTLYGLKRSPLLWQKKLTSIFKSLRFKKISQESCIIISKNVIILFYVNDIVICYWKKDEKMAKNTVIGLKTRYTMNKLKSFK